MLDAGIPLPPYVTTDNRICIADNTVWHALDDTRRRA